MITPAFNLPPFTLLTDLEYLSGEKDTKLHPEDSHFHPLFQKYLKVAGRTFRDSVQVSRFPVEGKCHHSSYVLVLRGKGDLWSGYALCEKEWVSHSWVKGKSGRLLETTPIKREVYVGVPRLVQAADLWKTKSDDEAWELEASRIRQLLRKN